MNKKILIIDDNKAFVDMLDDLLTSEGFLVDYFFCTEEIEDYIILNKYDLILLDIMLDKINGLDFLKAVRSEIKRPVLFLTAKNTKTDIITGLNLGGDDYITKPFDNEYLIAKIKSHIRRENGNDKELLEFETVTIIADTIKVKYSGEELSFTKSEFDIIYLLAKSPEKTYSKEQIFSLIYSISPNSEIRVITQYIYQIRTKFAQYNLDPIKNIWGVGYQWNLR